MRFALGLPTTEVDAPEEFLTGSAIAEMARHAEALAREHADEIGRTAPFDICFAPLSASKADRRDDRDALRDELAAYEELGVTHCPVVVHGASTRAEWMAKAEQLAADLVAE